PRQTGGVDTLSRSGGGVSPGRLVQGAAGDVATARFDGPHSTFHGSASRPRRASAGGDAGSAARDGVAGAPARAWRPRLARCRVPLPAGAPRRAADRRAEPTSMRSVPPGPPVAAPRGPDGDGDGDADGDGRGRAA